MVCLNLTIAWFDNLNEINISFEIFSTWDWNYIKLFCNLSCVVVWLLRLNNTIFLPTSWFDLIYGRFSSSSSGITIFFLVALLNFKRVSSKSYSYLSKIISISALASSLVIFESWIIYVASLIKSSAYNGFSK